MKARSFFWSLLLAGTLLGAVPGCIGSLPDDLPYGCETEADCGGGGYVCTTLPDQRRYCCLPEPETCNHIDDDCNGIVDDVPGGSCTNNP